MQVQNCEQIFQEWMLGGSWLFKLKKCHSWYTGHYKKLKHIQCMPQKATIQIHIVCVCSFLVYLCFHANSISVIQQQPVISAFKIVWQTRALQIPDQLSFHETKVEAFSPTKNLLRPGPQTADSWIGRQML